MIPHYLLIVNHVFRVRSIFKKLLECSLIFCLAVVVVYMNAKHTEFESREAFVSAS